MKKSNHIHTDFDTLKLLVSEATLPWMRKILTTLIIGNISLILTIGWGVITDHFTLKSIVALTAIHSTQLDNLNDRASKAEGRLDVHDARIKNIEHK